MKKHDATQQQFKKTREILKDQSFDALPFRIPIDYHDQLINLITVRIECLRRNTHFLKDYRAYQKGKMEPHEIKEFRKKWHFNERNLMPLDLDHPVTASPDGDFFGKLIMNIDLRFSKKKIMEHIKAEINKWHDMYREECNENFRERLFVEYDNQKPIGTPYDVWKKGFNKYLNAWLKDEKKLIERLTQQKHDIDYYEKCLWIYDLKENKEEHNTWADIVKKLGLQYNTNTYEGAVSHARNCYNRAKKMIREGVPGLAKFPQR